MTENKIEELELIREVFENKKAQKWLVKLYAESQKECSRNGKCNMEIGMAREKDQGAVLKIFLGDKINLNIDNALLEDYVVLNGRISAKHSSAKVGTPVKAKWSSADVSVKQALKEMIEAPDDYYMHLLLTYIDAKRNIITIICISSESHRSVIKELKEDAYTVPKGNSRGIQYSAKAMKMLINSAYFTIKIENADISGGLDPIERRMQLLLSLDD